MLSSFQQTRIYPKSKEPEALSKCSSPTQVNFQVAMREERVQKSSAGGLKEKDHPDSHSQF